MVGSDHGMTPARVIIKLASDIKDDADVAKVVDGLRQDGFILIDHHPSIGVLTGTCAESKFESLSGVPGVVAIEKERHYHMR